MTINIVMCVVGVFFICGAFYAAGIGGAFSRGPYRPISGAGRVILLLSGITIFISGLDRLLMRSGLLHGWLRGAVALSSVVVVVVVLNLRRVRSSMATGTSQATFSIEYPNGLPSELIAVRIAMLRNSCNDVGFRSGSDGGFSGEDRHYLLRIGAVWYRLFVWRA